MDRDTARRVLDTKTYISQKVDRNLIRGCQSIKTCANKLVLASWNVEGLTDAKIISLQQTMIQQSIDILAIQETHRRLSDYWVTSEGFLIILSGRSDEQRESAGVGFIVSPALRSSILGFCQATSRYACLKVRSSGGKIAIVSAYAPQSGRPFEERFSFFQDLLHFWKSISSHGPKFLLGDFNARLYQQFAGEEEIFGSFYVKNQRQQTLSAELNRFLLVEFCVSCDLQIGNTFFDLPLENLVIYRTPGTNPLIAITSSNFA